MQLTEEKVRQLQELLDQANGRLDQVRVMALAKGETNSVQALADVRFYLRTVTAILETISD